MTVPGARRTVYRVPRVSADRIYVSDVTPQVDCGRWPAKACVGDRVEVTATIARDGHETLRAVVRFRRPKGRWREEPLASIVDGYHEVGMSPLNAGDVRLLKS